MIFIGIDPGLTGGVVVMDEASKILAAYRMPTVQVKKGRREYDAQACAKVIEQAAALGRGVMIYSELVHARPHVAPVDPDDEGESEKNQQGHGTIAAFRLGYGFGLWNGLAAGAGVPFATIPPQVWYARLVGASPPEYRARKKRAADVARAKWPALPLKTQQDWGMADAAFIAEGGRLTWLAAARAKEEAIAKVPLGWRPLSPQAIA